MAKRGACITSFASNNYTTTVTPYAFTCGDSARISNIRCQYRPVSIECFFLLCRVPSRQNNAGKPVTRVARCAAPRADREKPVISLPSGTRIWLVAGVTDMRKSFNGLGELVQHALDENPFSGHLFIFRGRKGDTVKILWADVSIPHNRAIHI